MWWFGWREKMAAGLRPDHGSVGQLGVLGERSNGRKPSAPPHHPGGAGEETKHDLAVLAGTDFFRVEVVTWRGLVTYNVLFFVHLETRRVSIAASRINPQESWMQQMARKATLEGDGWLSERQVRYVVHDRDTIQSSVRRLGRRWQPGACSACGFLRAVRIWILRRSAGYER